MKDKIKELLERSGKDGMEFRNITAPASIETREDGTVGSIYGYPIVYNKDSEDMGFIERVAPGAARNALKRSDVRGLKNHDPSLIFAREGVNLKLTEDKDGLRYDATPIDTRNFREIAEEVRLGLLTGQSFGFTILSDEWKDLDTDHPTRTITEIGEIYDIGPVTYPAYQDTSVGLRSLEKAREDNTDNGNDPEPTITIMNDNEAFTFTDENRFEEAENKLKSIRSELNPTIPDPDNTDDDPTIITPSETDIDETLDKINQTIERLKS